MSLLRRLTPLGVSLAAVSFALLAIANPALAHDHLTTMSPAVGSTVAALPANVSLTFDNSVATIGGALVVTDPSGHAVSTGKPSVVDSTISIGLVAGDTVQGAYSVRYRIISADGHEVSDTLAFEVGAGGTAQALSQTAAGGEEKHDYDHTVHFVIAGVALLLSLVFLAYESLRRRKDDPSDEKANS